MTPSPHPSTSSLQPLNPPTSHNNNNNNGGLYAYVRAAEDIEPIRLFWHVWTWPLDHQGAVCVYANFAVV